MPTTTTFNTLQSDIRSYLERGFTSDSDPIVYNQIPRLINNAERKLARVFKILGTQEVVTSEFVIGTSVYQKPDRWRDTISFNYGAGANSERRTFIYNRSYEFIRMYWPDPTVVGAPKYYSDYNFNNWLIGPTPDIEYPFEVVYHQLPPMLDAITQSNWVSEYAPDAILYGSLLEAEPFIKDDKRIATWKGMYEEAIASITGEDIRRMVDRTSTRIGA
jgi:hypothetical protein